MSDRPTKRESGFSLIEMVVAMALGTVVLGAAVSIYVQAMNATWTVTQRAEMQQDFRAASNLLKNDLSLAGAGLGNGAGIQLPTSATLPVLGCDQTPKCYINPAAGTPVGSVAYPVQGTTPFLFGLLPGYQKGPTINTMLTDVVTVVYTDPTFALNCYTAKVTNSTTVTFTLPGTLTCTLPISVGTPQGINDAGVGLTPGDLIWFSFNSSVVAEVTAVSGSSVTFAANDVLKMNQATATNSLSQIATNTTGTGTRILVVTYYLDNTVNPARLMRQVSGHTPIPVAENVVYLQFTYDLFNSATNTVAVQQCNPGVSVSCNPSPGSVGLLPNQITKINIANMEIDSSQNGTRFGQNGYQRLDLQTSVSARNLTYVNNYPQ
jgi:prepilin-type N-terminal cleavage/methylation domain-containing protein